MERKMEKILKALMVLLLIPSFAYAGTGYGSAPKRVVETKVSTSQPVTSTDETDTKTHTIKSEPSAMPAERTLSIIKPNATKRNLTGLINTEIENIGLRIVAQKRIQLTKAQAEAFYAEHQGKPFFPSLVGFMTSGPVVVQILEGHDCIKKYRDLMGNTDPRSAVSNSIRKKYGENKQANSVHGSDSKASAAREMKFFFSELEIVG
jgi:nucleoside-diphosphate kinase